MSDIAEQDRLDLLELLGVLGDPSLDTEERESAICAMREILKNERFSVRRVAIEDLRQPQGPTTGINAIVGKWPGDETDEEVDRMLEELS